MGAGAGYSIKGTIDYDSIKINWFEVEEPFVTTEEYDDGYTSDYQIIPIKCDIDCAAEDVVGESYYDGGTLRGYTPIKITELSLIPKYFRNNIEDISEIDESVIVDALDGLKFDVSLGGGWVHSTFTGDISCDGRNLSEPDYADFYFNEIVMYITNNQAIKAIDTYVRGDNYSDEYKVVDIYGDDIEFFDNYDDAVEYAKENNSFGVLGSRLWYEYIITDGGDVESEIFDIDDEICRDWTNPNYIDED